MAWKYLCILSKFKFNMKIKSFICQREIRSTKSTWKSTKCFVKKNPPNSRRCDRFLDESLGHDIVESLAPLLRMTKSRNNIVCPRSLDHIYIIRYYIKTSWTHSTIFIDLLFDEECLMWGEWRILKKYFTFFFWGGGS